MTTIRPASSSVRWSFLIVLIGSAPAVLAGQPRDARSALPQIEVTKGICVVLGDPRCELAIGVAKKSELVLYIQVQDEEGRQAACRAAEASGLYGTRIYVGSGGARIGMADNVAE